MIYLSGAWITGVDWPPELGLMITIRAVPKIDLSKFIWAADTGCFSIKGSVEFSITKYLKFLNHRKFAVDKCLFATAPDVLGNATLTLKRSLPELSKIRKADFPAAFVGQNGILDTEIPWDEFDYFFIGGDIEWKLGKEARSIVEEALSRNKKVHMGRVNSLERILYALRIGCHSVDGNYLVYQTKTKGIETVSSWIQVLKEIENGERNNYGVKIN